MALEVALKYSNRIGVRTTGKKMLINLAEKISHRLGCNDRDVKIALLKLHVFVTPGQHGVASLRGSLPAGVGQEEWFESMYTPTNLLGIGFSEGLREELKCVSAWRVMDEIEALPKSSQQNHI